MSEQEPRETNEIQDEVFDLVGNVIDSTATLVNTIRTQVRKNLQIADELEELSGEFRDIASLQHELACRIAQLGAEALSSDFVEDQTDEEEDAAVAAAFEEGDEDE